MEEIYNGTISFLHLCVNVVIYVTTMDFINLIHYNDTTFALNIYLLVCFCCCSVTQSCPTLSDPMDCSMSGFPDIHQLSDLA